MTTRKQPAFRFGTVGSPQTTPKKPGGSPGGIAQIRALGLAALELAWVQSVRVTDASCAVIRATALEHDVALSVHAPYYINLNSLTTELMDASRARLLAAARAGAKAGATDIIFHPASYHTQPPEQVYERVKTQLLELTALLRAEGVDVTLRPELTGKGAMFGTLDEIIQLSADVPGVRPCIDFAHLHARTNGRYNTYAEFSAALKLVRKTLGVAGLRDLHIHLSGIAYNEKGERNHLTLKESDLALDALLQALLDAGARGRILCESPAMEYDALMMQAAYQRLTLAQK